RPGSGRPGGAGGPMSTPGAPRSGGANGAGLPGGATGGPVAPGHGGGTGSFDVTEALAAGPLAGGTRPGQGGGTEPRRDDLPYVPDDGGGRNGYAPANGQGGVPGAAGVPGVPGAPAGAPGGPNGFTGADAPGGPRDFSGPGGGGRGGRSGPQGPAGPTGGPVTGDGPMIPPMNGTAPGAATGTVGAPRAPQAPGGPGGPGVPGGPGAQAGPGGPGGLGVQGGPGTGPLFPGGGLSDDTAILTPQQPAPEPGPGGGYGRHDNVSGQTVTSGIPVVPPGGQGAGPGGPFAPGAHPDGPLPHTPPQQTEPAAQSTPAAGSKKKKKKGRSKLVLLGGLIVVGAAGAYGAGLLMNHSDVPKGTTVLGVDIGGGTRDDAVKKLDSAFDTRVNQALKLSVDGGTVTLKPDQAGLQFDMQATVDEAAHSDYNPVSVIGSLFGQQRVVEPVMPVDEEKLQAALESAAGGSGSATDGSITFKAGKAVAVYGKAGKGIDATQAETAVVAAYRALVENGTTAPVKVPTTTKQPTVTDAEVDRMMKEFAEPAMSGTVTVQTDAAHSVAFSPENSLWKFLEVKAVDGKLVDSYDEAALKELYGGTFDGVKITRATGQKTDVTVQDVIGALRLALKSTTDRVGVIETDPS
ncbi:hypothetical protein, partial [Streptomyces sp. NPDC059894]